MKYFSFLIFGFSLLFFACNNNDQIPAPCCNNSYIITGTIDSNYYEFGNVITINGDGYNDFLVIENIHKTNGNNSLEILDDYGNQLYYRSDYQNDFGGKDQSGNILQDGTYKGKFICPEYTMLFSLTIVSSKYQLKGSCLEDCKYRDPGDPLLL